MGTPREHLVGTNVSHLVGTTGNRLDGHKRQHHFQNQVTTKA